MPTYEYACKSCGEHLEVVQSFKDDALTTCSACGGPLRKVFGTIGISFRGSGFYRTDSRPAAKSEPAADKSSGDKSSGDKSGAASGDKSSSASSDSSKTAAAS